MIDQFENILENKTSNSYIIKSFNAQDGRHILSIAAIYSDQVSALSQQVASSQ